MSFFFKKHYFINLKKIYINNCRILSAHITYLMVITCMIRKWGLLTFKPTEQNRSWTRRLFAFTPLMRYLLRPPMTTCTTQIPTSRSHSLKWAAIFKMSWFEVIYLSCDGNLVMRLKPKWTLFLIGVVKSDGHCCLGDSSQAIFVNQILEISGTNLQNKQLKLLNTYYVFALYLSHLLFKFNLFLVWVLSVVVGIQMTTNDANNICDPWPQHQNYITGVHFWQ